MAAVLNNLFGGSKSSATPVPSGDSDFADFAGAPDPTPLPLTATGDSTLGGAQASVTARPYTKWYRVHERHSLDEFYSEGIILGVIAVIVVLHLFGARMNRSKARSWIRAHAKPLASEFALVGFGSLPAIAADNASDEVLKELKNANEANPNSLLKEKSLFEFATYATGRQNVAFLDVKLTLLKRFNPITTIFEQVMGFFVESAGAPEDNLEAVIYPFDGKEALTVPGLPGAHEGKAKDSKSAFDGFVWALVSKDHMKQIRDDRYDVSLTYTKDHPKLPSWLSVMSESAEITDALLTPELIKAAQDAGDNFQYLIVSDQPVDKPKTIDETTPRKRIFLRYKLPSNNNYESLVPLFSYFIRMPDALVQSGRFRPEVLRKVKNVREEMIKQLRKADEEEKAEERAAEREKARKQKRDAELNALDAKAQKKYLEKEREKEMRKMQKRQTTRA